MRGCVGGWMVVWVGWWAGPGSVGGTERECDLHSFIRRREADSATRFEQGSAGISVTRGPLLDRSTLELWASQLASGLAFLHSHSIVHRDLKPGNILLVWQGAGMRVEIADFGAARETLAPSDKKRRLHGKSAVNLSHQSVTAQFENLTHNVGTMMYTAPEAWFGGEYGYSIDVWAFGAIIFELLTFQVFTPGRKAVDMVASVLSRLGCQEEAESHILGPLQPPLVAAAVHALSEGGGHTLPSLAACAASAPPRGLWDQVTAALMWRPQARITAKVLSQSLPRPDITEPAAHAPQPAKGCVDASQPAAEFPAGLPAGLSMTQSTKSLAGSMDLTTLPLPG